MVAFNTADGWSRDITEEIARDILGRAHRKGELLSQGLQDFVERATGEAVPANLSDQF